MHRTVEPSSFVLGSPSKLKLVSWISAFICLAAMMVSACLPWFYFLLSANEPLLTDFSIYQWYHISCPTLDSETQTMRLKKTSLAHSAPLSPTQLSLKSYISIINKRWGPFTISAKHCPFSIILLEVPAPGKFLLGVEKASENSQSNLFPCNRADWGPERWGTCWRPHSESPQGLLDLGASWERTGLSQFNYSAWHTVDI